VTRLLSVSDLSPRSCGVAMRGYVEREKKERVWCVCDGDSAAIFSERLAVKGGTGKGSRRIREEKVEAERRRRRRKCSETQVYNRT
jgi:hypothetical protein